MAHALVTIVAPLALGRLHEAEAAIDALGNPARPDIAEALSRLDPDGLGGTHFTSLHAFRSPDAKRAYLLLEYSADGTAEAALQRIVAAIGDGLGSVFRLARDWSEGRDLTAYLLARRVDAGSGWSQAPGLAFAGTPGLSVGRIRKEARLAAALADLIESQPAAHSPLERLAHLRTAIAGNPDLAPMLEPAQPGPPYAKPSLFAAILSIGTGFLARYLWPVGALMLAWGLYSGVRAAWVLPWFWPKVRVFVGGLVSGLWSSLWVALVAVLIGAVIAYVALRRAEASDTTDERLPERDVNAAIFERENRAAQNHMISITERKPGFLRSATLRLVFFVIGKAAGYLYPPGFLGTIGTIHFARWVTMPGSRDLIFLSNYGGSWESYLEDFITRASNGLTGVWSNSIGFPRAENLVQKGAADGDRFKRYARRSMVPTRFWFTAYPTLTTAVIRTNAEIRRGFSGAMTHDEAAAFFALFGSAQRPDSKLVSSEIQSIVFGGLGFMPAGACLLLDLPEDRERARQWLRDIKPFVAFNDGRRLRAPAVATLSFGARGLARLGLPQESLEGFSFPFLEGMTGPSRARLLGDTGVDAPDHWYWGKTQPDVALLVYGEDENQVTELVRFAAGAAEAAGMPEPHVIPLKHLTPDKTEPFGFRDGISQPVIRGTYKAFRNTDPIHLVEPGEFILGYPDNRGDSPPGPTLVATADPENILPLREAPDGFDRTVVDLPRDLGFNGSYLVIRQLEQHVEAFDAYCEREAERLTAEDRLPQPYVITPEFIGAKMVGRWKDGSSLVRHPYESPSEIYRTRPSRAEGAMMRPLSTTAAALTPVLPPAAPEEPTQRDAVTGQAAFTDRREPRINPDNDFLFGTEDPEALRCPFGSHVRRANPRESQMPGSAEQISITNRHRIMRVGRFYQEEDGEDPGLLFMCLNADIERQFEFLQQTWLKAPSFHGLACEKDPLLGDEEVGVCSYTIPARSGPVRLQPMPRFVTVRGGGYFFLPGKRLIDWLST